MRLVHKPDVRCKVPSIKVFFHPHLLVHGAELNCQIEMAHHEGW
jgi:hypothetical protein